MQSSLVIPALKKVLEIYAKALPRAEMLDELVKIGQDSPAYEEGLLMFARASLLEQEKIDAQSPEKGKG